MKIKNKDVVNFMNNEGKIMQKKLPNRLCFAIDVNTDTLRPAAMACNKRYEKIVEGSSAEKKTAEITELLELEVEATIQTIPKSLLEQMDENPKFDALTGAEYACIQFMTE